MIVKPVSLFELSAQDRLICFDDAAAATRFVGAAGIPGVGVGVGDSCACVIGNGANHTRAIASARDVTVADLKNFIVLPLSSR